MPNKSQNTNAEDISGLTPETANPKINKPKFTLERLRDDCLKIFGVTTSTFDGATLNLSGEFTTDEIKNKIEKWQSTPIKLTQKKGSE